MYDLVQIDRKPIDEHPLEGFLLERTKELLLLHLVNSGVVCLNGYSVVRRTDVRKLKVERKDCFMIRALRMKGIEPSKPSGVSIASWPDLLESLNEQFPLFTIHHEWLDSEVCYIGRLAARSAKTFGLKEIDPDARWNRSRSYKFKDLTKVDFGGGYETGLASLATTRVKRTKAKIRGLKSTPVPLASAIKPKA